ncbi:antibiotic biosynthesis monooxygenase family protein [Paramicrobacterium chengjingii]|uniref:Antibiotic biosynthesis monooxygenase n=1 Tax=Paramicrobacterium chengjingii TaxID=2769067 RepID=A0ABX6YH70_9MICO|nr:antibiotic biosynthesis monooxygenase [Microbacterium chengjingii]QPZ38137.1 antibiotic biosynthesis monooxygenase [Microbacterium chengjingii]
MIRTILTFDVPLDRIDSILEAYEREQILQRAMEEAGGISTDIAVATDNSGRVLVTALWPDEEAYQRWVDNPFRAESNGRLGDLMDGVVGIGQTFRVKIGAEG